MHWKIGQRIVAIINHSQGVFKKGDEFIIKGLRESFCKCLTVNIDIGKNGDNLPWECGDCGKVHKASGNAWWFSEECFAPLEEKEDTIELSEVLVDENGIVQEELIKS